jgi:hypothetical protein
MGLFRADEGGEFGGRGADGFGTFGDQRFAMFG